MTKQQIKLGRARSIGIIRGRIAPNAAQAASMLRLPEMIMTEGRRHRRTPATRNRPS
jgi:hypothetical protein